MAKNSTKKKRRRSTSSVPLIVIGAGFILIAVVLLVFIGNGQKEQEASASSNESMALANGMSSAVPAEVEFDAPELTLITVSGEEQSLADYRGQVVLVNNWATWCPPCTAEMPELQAFYEAHADDGFVIIAIEAGEPEAVVSTFVESNGLTFPVWLDPDTQSVRAFNAPSLPNSFVIDQGGTVRLAWTGAISQGMLEQYIAPMLNN